MKTGMRKAAIYDPATGTVVQINNLSPDGEFQKGSFEAENSAGGKLYGGPDSNIEIMSFEMGGFAQLQTWMNDETLLNLVVFGIEEHILWYEPTPIVVKKNYGMAVGSRNGFTITMESAAGENNILQGSNLLQTFFDWKDAVAPTNQADNYDIVGSMTASLFSSFVQTLITSGAQTNIRFLTNASLIFPIANAKMQLSVRVDTLVNGASLVILVDPLNYASATLGTQSALLSVGFIEFTTPANTYKLECNILRGDSDGSLDCDLAYPYLGVQLGAHKVILY